MDSSKKDSKERVLTIFFFSFENYSRESRFLTGVRKTSLKPFKSIAGARLWYCKMDKTLKKQANWKAEKIDKIEKMEKFENKMDKKCLKN